MSLVPEHCILTDNHNKYCAVDENGKKYSLENKSGFRIQKIQVDKCFVQRAGEKRCDFLLKLETSNPKKAIFVELKGSGLNRAIEQVLDTSVYLKSELKDYELLVRVVGRGGNVPNFRTTISFQRLVKIIKNESNFHHATNGSYAEKF